MKKSFVATHIMENHGLIFDEIIQAPIAEQYENLKREYEACVNINAELKFLVSVTSEELMNDIEKIENGISPKIDDKLSEYSTVELQADLAWHIADVRAKIRVYTSIREGSNVNAIFEAAQLIYESSKEALSVCTEEICSIQKRKQEIKKNQEEAIESRNSFHDLLYDSLSKDGEVK